MKLYLISYDIREDRIRTRAANLLKDFGDRVQKSVFECRLSARDLNTLENALTALTDPKTDSILIYPLCEACVKLRRSAGFTIIREEGKDYTIL